MFAQINSSFPHWMSIQLEKKNPGHIAWTWQLELRELAVTKGISRNHIILSRSDYFTLLHGALPV